MTRNGSLDEGGIKVNQAASRLPAVMLALAAVSILPGVSQADNDQVSASERTQIMQALARAGCNSPREMERDDGGYEVDDAQCKGGVYDLKLDRQFNVVVRSRQG